MPDKFDDLKFDEPRLIIPFKNDRGDMIGLQGRSFNPDAKLRYITLMVDENYPKIYGVDALDTRDTIYVFEGPIDSMFIPNSIASAGGDIISELPRLMLDKTQYVVIYDNEPRNIHTVRKMEKAIDAGYTVCIWPDTITQKDVNDMIKAEVTDTSFTNTELINRIANRLRKVIDQNAHSGLAAKLKLTAWRKCQ
jgi:DNA primase